MTNQRSIVISGDLGSGKSTVSSLLATRLNLRRVSVGDLYRDMAYSRGISALQVNIQAERDESMDDRVDQLQAKMAESNEQLVVDSRLGWFFFATAFKVHLIVDPAVAAKRVMARPASNVEAYSSVAEAVDRLRNRSDSERARFLKKYGIDKARLRNYDIVCDATRARPEEIADKIVAVFSAPRDNQDLRRFPPDTLLDPRRVYPSQNIKELRGLWESGFVEEVRRGGPGQLKPISVGYSGRYFFAIGDHWRLSAAVQNDFTLIRARLLAEAKEYITADFLAQQYFEETVRLSTVYDWEAVHKTELELPRHLASQEASVES